MDRRHNLGRAVVGAVALVAIAALAGARPAVAATAGHYTAAIQQGTCQQATGKVAFTLKGKDAPDDLGPYGEGIAPRGVTPAQPLVYGHLEVKDLELKQLLDQGAYSLLIAAEDTGKAAACGDLGGPVDKKLLGGDTLVIGLRAIGGSNLGGIAQLAQKGTLHKSVEVTVFLVPQVTGA